MERALRQVPADDRDIADEENAPFLGPILDDDDDIPPLVEHHDDDDTKSIPFLDPMSRMARMARPTAFLRPSKLKKSSGETVKRRRSAEDLALSEAGHYCSGAEGDSEGENSGRRKSKRGVRVDATLDMENPSRKSTKRRIKFKKKQRSPVPLAVPADDECIGFDAVDDGDMMSLANTPPSSPISIMSE